MFVLIGCGWLLVRRYFPRGDSERKPGNDRKSRITFEQLSCLAAKAVKKAWSIKGLSLVYLSAMFVYVNTTSYLLISVLKEKSFGHLIYIPVLTICGVFVLARLLQTFILPKYPDRELRACSH